MSSSLRSIDRASLLAEVNGETPMADVESALLASDLTLDLSGPFEGTVAAWIAAGAPGSRSPWLDPADHLVAGFVAKLVDGRELVVRPAPRRAVGPDLFALVFGTGGRFGEITSAWLRVHPRGVQRPAIPFAHEDPPVETGEKTLWDAIEKVLQGPSNPTAS